MRGWRDREAPTQTAIADRRWAEMVAEAERMCAAGKSVSAEFILGAAERARRDQGEQPRVVPYRATLADFKAWRAIAGDKPK